MLHLKCCQIQKDRHSAKYIFRSLMETVTKTTQTIISPDENVYIAYMHKKCSENWHSWQIQGFVSHIKYFHAFAR